MQSSHSHRTASLATRHSRRTRHSRSTAQTGADSVPEESRTCKTRCELARKSTARPQADTGVCVRAAGRCGGKHSRTRTTTMTRTRLSHPLTLSVLSTLTSGRARVSSVLIITLTAARAHTSLSASLQQLVFCVLSAFCSLIASHISRRTAYWTRIRIRLHSAEEVEDSAPRSLQTLSSSIFEMPRASSELNWDTRLMYVEAIFS